MLFLFLDIIISLEQGVGATFIAEGTQVLDRSCLAVARNNHCI